MNLWIAGFAVWDLIGFWPSVFSSSSAILREEVKYVHTDTDLMITEKAARGKKDIVLGYVLSLGTRGTEKNEGVNVVSYVKSLFIGLND